MATAASDWGQPTYKLVFDAGTELHGADSPFLWGPQASVNNQTIADVMKDYYLGFVLNLDPNSVSYSGTPKPEWPLYQGAAGFNILDVNYTEIGKIDIRLYIAFADNCVGVVPDFDANERCDFFHGQNWIVRN